MSFIRPEGNNIISTFIIDRVACGISAELIRTEFEKLFKQPLSDYTYNFYCDKYADDIAIRREQIRELIYNSGTYSKLIEISDTLLKYIREGGSPKEVSSLAATLRGYLETMSKLGLVNDTKTIKQQNNYLIFQSLAKDGLIEIKDTEKLKYLIDGTKNE